MKVWDIFSITLLAERKDQARKLLKTQHLVPKKMLYQSISMKLATSILFKKKNRSQI